MQVLFVAALKNQPCNLFGTPRHERNEWKQRLLPMRHTVRSRDQDQDWRVLTGDTSDILSTGTRSIRFLIVSTLTDTLLEWSFFLQDVAPYLNCAHGSVVWISWYAICGAVCERRTVCPNLKKQ